MDALAQQLQDLPIEIYRFPTLDSTNNEARRRLPTQEKPYALYIAQEQSAGRGRRGRDFYSPPNTGLYMSLAQKTIGTDSTKTLVQKTTNTDSTKNTTLTAFVAVAVAEAVAEITGHQVGIKWVNDLYYQGKKVCGILCERVQDGTIIGVGINLLTADFPASIAETAGALMADITQKDRLTAAITRRLAARPDTTETYMHKYRARSLVLGKPVRFEQNGVWKEGVAEDIADDAALWVRLPSGERLSLRSGEITLRLQ